MRWMFALIAFSFSACREIEPFSPQGSSTGYQLEGSVTTANGFPIGGAEIRIFYDLEGSYLPQDTTRLFISDSTAIVQVSVLDPAARLVKAFTPPRRAGYLSRRIWDERDSTGGEAKNGVYLIRIYVDDVFALQYQWLVDAHVTAVTDGNGQFFVPGRSLPVGQIIDVYDSLGVYDRTYSVASTIAVRASTSSAQRTVFVTLTRDAITQVYIIF